MLEPHRPSFPLKGGWVCSVGTRINEVFEMLRIDHVPSVTIPSCPYPLQSSLPSAYAHILPVFCEKRYLQSKCSAKHMAFKQCPDTWE